MIIGMECKLFEISYSYIKDHMPDRKSGKQGIQSYESLFEEEEQGR